MYVVAWQYEVRPGGEAAFERLYGPQGAWVVLFREFAGFRGTELLRDGNGRYLTLDRWDSAEAYDAFLAAAHPRYAAIDAEGGALTASEQRIGAFVTTT